MQRPKSAEVFGEAHWYENASHDDESWGDTGLQAKFAQTAKHLREYAKMLMEKERTTK